MVNRSRRASLKFDHDEAMQFIVDELGLVFDSNAVNMIALGRHMGVSPHDAFRILDWLASYGLIRCDRKRVNMPRRWYVISAIDAARAT